MKIGIITLQLHANYGGILQAYALQTVLKRAGHEVDIIQTGSCKKIPLWKFPLSYGKRLVLKYLFRKKIRVFFEKWYNRTDPSLVRHMKKFVDSHISVRNVRSYNDIREGDYEGFVVGSDQIWRPVYFGKPICHAYLSFAKGWKGIKRVGYAISFGVAKWEYTGLQTKECRKLVRLFDAVSVREDVAVELCKHWLHRNAIHVLDPTMLLTADDYIKMFDGKIDLYSKGELLTYILDESAETENVVRQVSERFGYTPFRANSRYEDIDAPLAERVQPPVEEWLKKIYSAKFIVTDSFHAVVFSILFGKPFIVIGNKDRGLSRINSLLKIFGLERHLLIKGKPLNLDINYTLESKTIQSILELWRKKSIEYLTSNLE